MSSSPNPVRKKRHKGRPKPFKMMTRTLIFLGFIFYSLLSFAYFFEPEFLSNWTKLYFYIYPFIFLVYVYTFKMDCKKGNKKCLSAVIFNILFLALLSTFVFFISGIIMNPGSDKNKLHIAVTVFFMCGVMLLDFFIVEYIQGLFKPKSRRGKNLKNSTQIQTPRPSISQASIYKPQDLESTIEIIYGSPVGGCTSKSSNVVSSKEML